LGDGFALTTASGDADFATIARSAAMSLFAGDNHVTGDPQAIAELVSSGLGSAGTYATRISDRCRFHEAPAAVPLLRRQMGHA
jgi:hypothetical protein